MGVYSKNRSTINESYIFSGDDIVLNFDKWKANTPNNILYVTGLSGSGKSTLAEEYEKKYNAEMFELDGIEGEYDSSKSNLLQKLKDKYPDYNTGVKNAWKDYNDYEYHKLFIKYTTFIVSEIKKSGKLFIIEGLQIFENIDPDTLKHKPLIIKGSSVTKSIYQKCKREGNYKKIDWIAELKTKNLSFFKYCIMAEKRLNKFRKGVKESTKNKTYLQESENKSKIDIDYESKGHMKLSSFNKTKLTRELAKENGVDYGETTFQDFKGYLYTEKSDNSIIVALVAVATDDDKKSWIQPVKVYKKYKGYGLSKQLLDVAVKELGAKYLSVYPDNVLAIDIYKKYGFKIYKKNKWNMYLMTLDPNQKIDKSYINESRIAADNLPDIMYFSSSKKITSLKGRVFLSPLKGISSMFIVDKKDLILPKHRKCSFNIGYKEWEYPDSKLKNALNEVHITHNIKSINSIERGKSSGYIYTIDISKIKNKLSLFVTEDQNREVIYNGDESLKIVKVEPHSIEWTFEYDQDNADMHGYGFLNENSTILLEAGVGRRWKCPYCNYHESREGLVSHVEREHSEMLSEDFSAARAVFNYINKKEHGTCIVCRKETKFSEETWRYNRLCDNPKCEKEYVDSFKKNMIGKHGVVHMLNDPEQQKKMLANRKISGTYKFADGGIRSYCGTYEKKALEFYDKVMNVHSKDVITPGPIVEYEYNGKTLKWITDLYYVPANLVHDIKDGGSNPNGRQMDDYRAKQIAKEDAISKMGKYNYIRLTDNSFDQLLLVLAEIKSQMMDNVKDEYVIRINEALLLENIKGAKINETTSTAAALPNQNNQSDSVYIIPYTTNLTFDVALSTDKYFSNIYKIKDGKIVKGSVDDLYESTYSVYKYTGNDAIELCESILNDYNNGVDIDSKFYLYEKVCGKRLMDENQFEYDEMLEESIDWFTESVLTTQIHQATLMHKFNKENKSQLYTEVTDTINEGVVLNQKGCKILHDIDGYFVYNESTERRTKSYDTISSIPYINIVLDKLSK